MTHTNYKNDGQDQDEQELEQQLRESFAYFESIVFSQIVEMPRLAEAFSTIQKEEFYRFAGHTDFHEYLRARFGVPPQFAVLVQDFFGKAEDTNMENS